MGDRYLEIYNRGKERLIISIREILCYSWTTNRESIPQNSFRS
nr:MAG TPA: hypothetical protein [Caudoviricetes sp.]